MIDENTWGMLLGRSGQLLGELGDDIKALATAQGREFYTGNPQDLYPDALPEYRQKMKAKGWETGTDEEELLEYAMHPGQYEAFKSGEAKTQFQEDLAKRKSVKQASPVVSSTATTPPVVSAQPREMTITVDGKAYRVAVSYETDPTSAAVSPNAPTSPPVASPPAGNLKSIFAPLEGKFLLTKDSAERPIAVGDMLKVGDTVAYIESMKVINAITADQAGVVVEILGRHGEDIEEDDIIVRLS
jgi:pyruvate carboxylase subunit B